VRTGPESARAARALDARAFTTPAGVIHLGGGASAGDDRLLLHEAAHTLQQPPGGTGADRLSEPGDRFEANAHDVAAAAGGDAHARVLAGGAGVVRRDVVSEVKDKLSYELLDWAITDAEATDAFALLDAVPDADLPGVLTKIGPTAVSRLLDNLPGELKTGPKYTRIIQTLGTGATLPFVLDQLQTGLFDWAVTDAEVNQIFNVYTNLAPTQQDQFWTTLAARGRLGKLVSNMSEAHDILYLRPWVRTLVKGATAAEPNPNAAALTDPQKTVLRTMVEETDSLATADLLLEARFNVTIARFTAAGKSAQHVADNKMVGADFSVDQLRRIWVILEALPPGHVAGNAELDRLTRFEGAEGGPSGFYYGNPDLREATIGESGTGKRFSDVVRHEVGHGVDRKIGFLAKGEHTKAERGGWTVHASTADAAKEATTLSAAGVSALTGADRGLVEAEMVKVMDDHSKKPADLAGLKTTIRNLPLWAALPAATRDAKRSAALADPALQAVVANRGQNAPWDMKDGGVRLGTPARIVQESGTGDWTSYAFEARERAVSAYQFRAPAEWFAEAYVAYYAGGETEVDDLSKKDPKTKAWFDANVHNK
ncbi:MAG: eCIS core domain-containing protein, partial [Acidimicrobiales bacterium]